MTASPVEIGAMHRAIVLSALGLGTTSPNPPVGCVILDRSGEVVGEGFHLRKGEAHAEVRALTAAGGRARGGTAVVTLEPCNHQGRTPPCRQALIEAGIARTVIALIDPTSRGEGGAARLRAAGVEVEVGLLADAARLVLGPWLHALSAGRPHITWLGYDDPVIGTSLLEAHSQAFDAVIHPDGRITEGVPGGHGFGVFSIPDNTVEDIHATLRALHHGGVRSLLVIGDVGRIRGLSLDRLVDEVILYLTTSDSGVLLDRDALESLGGLVIGGVAKVGDTVRVRAKPRPPSS